MLSKQFGKKSVEAIIVGIYVGGTSLTRRPVRSLFGLKMKFGTNGWSIGTKKSSRRSPSKPPLIGVLRQEAMGVELVGI